MQRIKYPSRLWLQGPRLVLWEVGIIFSFQRILSKPFAASLGNPLFLIKARMQAYSPVLPVGTQHHYRSSFHALSTIFRAERFRGLVRGIDAAILRTSMGSSVQLPSYNFTKQQIVSRGWLPADSIWTFLASSSVSGICVVGSRALFVTY